MKNMLALAAVAAASAVSAAELAPIGEVRLAPGSVFGPAVAADRAYMLELDCDRLLAPFVREAGLPKKADGYGNWERWGLDGHTLGHYLSALANLIASWNDADGECRRRLDYIVDELDRIQRARGDGGLDGVPNGRELWSALAEGDVGPTFKRWVPWYNIHKTFAGLRDAWQLAGNRKAKDILVKLADWAIAVTSRVSEAEMQRMLGHEPGGMNEALADVAAITGDDKYLRAAERFTHREIVDPLYRHEDRLTGRHANTQIPKIVGLARIAGLSGDERKFDAADFFWRTVVQKRSVAFGGNSVSEHFHDVNDFMPLLKHREGPESCNTYNMLRLTERLFARRPRGEYIDFAERALYNHLLSAVNPDRPGFVYFTSIRPEHYRVYSTPQNCFWCCTGTGMENPGKYAALAYAQDEEALYVNLFMPGTWKGKGFTVRQTTKFPRRPSSAISVAARPGRFKVVKIRKPAWCRGFSLKVDGRDVPFNERDGFAEIPMPSAKPLRVDVSLPMTPRVEMLPDGSGWGAILCGPVLLAHPAGTNRLDGLFADDSRMGHVAHGPVVPLNEVPSIVVSPEALPERLVCGQDAFGEYRLDAQAVFDGRTGKTAEKPLELVPFATLHGRRYQIYWEFTTRERIAERAAELAAAEAARTKREQMTLDVVTCGEQQPETEHALAASEDGQTGLHEGRHWRHGRWIEYTLDARGAKAAELRLTLWGDDRGRTFTVTANGVALGEVALDGGPRAFIEKSFAIPSAALDSPDGKVRVRFEATRYLAGGLYEVRLVRPGAPSIP